MPQIAHGAHHEGAREAAARKLKAPPTARVCGYHHAKAVIVGDGVRRRHHVACPSPEQAGHQSWLGQALVVDKLRAELRA